MALLDREDGYQICWVGDSRAYRFSPESRRLDMLTSDHNVAGVLVASGALSPDEATRHPQRHVLTDCLGLAGDEAPRVDVLEGQWRPGEVILLCSDGLSGELGDREMERIFQDGDVQDAQSLVDTLLQGALAAGAHDNVSVVAVGAPEMPSQRRLSWRWPFWRRSGIT